MGQVHRIFTFLHAALMMDRILCLAMLLVAVPRAAGLATPVLETVAIRGAASSSLCVAEGQADTIDSGAYEQQQQQQPRRTPRRHTRRVGTGARSRQPGRAPSSSRPRLAGPLTRTLELAEPSPGSEPSWAS